jgi:hypothetical protein
MRLQLVAHAQLRGGSQDRSQQGGQPLALAGVDHLQRRCPARALRQRFASPAAASKAGGRFGRPLARQVERGGARRPGRPANDAAIDKRRPGAAIAWPMRTARRGAIAFAST